MLSRTRLLIGDDAVRRLNNVKVAVFGVGGVGGYAVEALARSGVGALELIDNDIVSVSNINRQIIATQETVGLKKAEAARQRVLLINPDCAVTVRDEFFLPDNADSFNFRDYDYVIDAVDTVSAKIELVLRCEQAGTPIISAMGAGNKLDASAFKVADIYKTSGCPLARVMRRELKARGVKALKVVYSEEQPIKPALSAENLPEGKRQVPGSVAFVPSVMGLIIAGEVIKDIGGIK